MCRELDNVVIFQVTPVNTAMIQVHGRHFVRLRPTPGLLQQTARIFRLRPGKRPSANEVSGPQRTPTTRMMCEHLTKGEYDIVGVALGYSITMSTSWDELVPGRRSTPFSYLQDLLEWGYHRRMPGFFQPDNRTRLAVQHRSR
jgi:hypothetical protein